MKKKHTNPVRFGTIIVCIFIVIGSFIRFRLANYQFISDNNRLYLESSTLQIGSTLDDLLNTKLAFINELSLVFPIVLNTGSRELVRQMLSTVITDSSFDSLRYLSPSNQYPPPDYLSAVYKRGMEGGTGVDFVLNEVKSGELVFFSPVRINEEIAGVLAGSCTSSLITDFLPLSYFQMETETYLLTLDGQIIAGSTRTGDVPQELANVDSAAAVEVQRMTRELARKSIETENNRIISGMPVYRGQFYLLHILPEDIGMRIYRQAMRIGENLILQLVLVFLIFLLWNTYINFYEKKRLKKINIDQFTITTGIASLFDTVFYIDFANDTCEHVSHGSRILTQEDTWRIQNFSSNMESWFSSMKICEEDRPSLRELISPEGLAHKLEKLPSRTSTETEYRVCKASGAQRWFCAEIVEIQKKDGKTVSIVVATRDITRKKQDEDSIRNALEEAYQTAINASMAKTDFLSHMSHDIRTPMNAIIGMTTIAASNIHDSAKVTECLKKIDISSHHMLNLVNEILDMSKIESGAIELQQSKFDIGKIISNLIAINQEAIAQKKQTLETATDDIEHETVIGDSGRLMQILVNLLSNAIKYTPEGGTIALRIRELYPISGDQVTYQFTIEDNGIGMSKEFLDDIFKPFRRDKNALLLNIEGTGLGMCITANLVRTMNGTINVESEENKGSRFTVHIPFKPSEPKYASHHSEFGGHTILVADDDKVVQKMMAHTLGSLGITYNIVESGEEAVRLVSSRSGIPYCAIFLDLKMLGIDGLETTRQIRTIVGTTIPIIMISSINSTELIDAATSAGATAFLEKPLFKSQIMAILNQFVGNKVPLDEPDNIIPSNKPFTGKHILIADDNEINREILCELLKTSGAELTTTTNGNEAVRAFESSAPFYYSIILMDIRMPEMNGYEATKMIRSLDRSDARQIPIIAMTADAFAEDVKQCILVGMNDHVPKPINIQKMYETISKWLKA